MELGAKPNKPTREPVETITVDVSLLNPPAAGECNIPIDRIMCAVNSVQGYVVSRLTRIGRMCDVDDLMQDIRVAVWDGVTKGRYRGFCGHSVRSLGPRCLQQDLRGTRPART